MKFREDILTKFNKLKIKNGRNTSRRPGVSLFMKGAVKILTAFNIPVFVHWSFGLILVYILYISQSEGFNLKQTGWSLLTVLGLFVCVTMHEYGHALAARRYGVGTRDIALYPIGGVARLERLPKKPLQEFVVAIAGPLVNFAIVLLLIPYVYFFPEGFDALLEEGGLATSALTFLPAIFVLNLVLGIFNLIPAFPMDGGRILRALLAVKLSRVNATLIAARVGQGFALLALYFAFTSEQASPMTGLIGAFIFMMAQQEYRFVKTEARLTENRVADIMRTNFTRFFPQEPMYSAISEVQKKVERNFLVFNQEDKLIGLLTEESIIHAVKEKRRTADVRDYMTPRIVAVTPETTLQQLYEVMQDGFPICPVMRGEEVLGVADVAGMNEFLSGRKRRAPKKVI